jgi:hypothetical protein
MQRLIILVIGVVLAIPCGIDWALAQSRLPGIEVTSTLSQPSVVADGKSEIDVVIRVTENGVPRANDLLQSWIDIGGGLLQPMWVYTDENGEATLTFAPNPITQYDVQDRAAIHVRDISIGRLVEVGKDVVVDIPLTAPQEEEQRSIFG